MPAEALKEVMSLTYTEFDLIRQAADGSHKAFKELFDNNVSRVYGLCSRISADRDIADELCQIVFIKAWQKLSDFRFGGKFYTWLHTIAVNEFLSMKRTQKRFIDNFAPFPSQKERSVTHETTGLKIDIESAIEKLPWQQRLAFILHDVEGFKHKEIAVMMEIEEGTSKSHVHRARKRMRDNLV